MSTKRRKRHTPEQIVRKLRDADAMFSAGNSMNRFPWLTYLVSLQIQLSNSFSVNSSSL